MYHNDYVKSSKSCFVITFFVPVLMYLREPAWQGSEPPLMQAQQHPVVTEQQVEPFPRPWALPEPVWPASLPV